MGVFEFILILVIISTVGKVLAERGRPVAPRQEPPPALPPREVERLRDSLDELAERVERLEEERDFYRELLEHPARRREIPPRRAPDHPEGPQEG